MTSGIYQIQNLANGKRYIGQASLLLRRRKYHRNRLRAGKHFNAHLQAAWNKYGEAAFVFKPLLICAPKDLTMYEQRCLDGYCPEYNLAPAAGSVLGIKRSAETRAKMALSKFGNKHNLGRPRPPEVVAKMRERRHTPETRAKMSAAAKRRAPKSAETRVKHAAALRANWAARKAAK